jgi:hypothetical protein
VSGGVGGLSVSGWVGGGLVWMGGEGGLSGGGLRVQESVCQCQVMVAGGLGRCWGWQCKCGVCVTVALVSSVYTTV